MRMHKQRLLDQQYFQRMSIQVNSKDPAKAEEARQGLALREASIAAQSRAFMKDNGLSASRASLMTLLEHFIAGFHTQYNRHAHVKQVIAAREAELLQGTQDPVDHQQDDDQQEHDQRHQRLSSLTKCHHATHSECLLARTGHPLYHSQDPSKTSPYQPGVFVPSRIPRQKRDKSASEKREETWGKSYCFEAGQERGLVAGIYQDAPPVIQRALIRKALAPNLILKFADWTPFRMKGRGRYRMAADLDDAVITNRLVECMGEAADIIGGLGPGVLIEGYSDMDFHTLLCKKYSKAMQRQFKPPYEDSTDGTSLARGFPQDFMPKMKAAEAFLAPTTFAVYDFMLPNGHITDHRLVFNHVWAGKNVAEENPANYTLENTFPMPQSNEDSKHDWGNLPINQRAKFENPAHPSHIMRPPRHSRVQGSDLEALEKRDEPPAPDEHVLRVATLRETNQKTPKAQPRRIANAEPRPTIARKIADKIKRDRAEKTKRDRNAAVLLGNRRRVVTETQVRVPNTDGQISSDDDEDGGVPIDLQTEITSPILINPGPPPSNSGIARTSINPGPPPSHSGIARLIARSHQERSGPGVRLPTSTEEESGVRLPTSTDKHTSAGTLKPETPPDAQSDAGSSSDDTHGSGNSDHNASPPLRSILVRRPINANESSQRRPKRSVCWATDISARNDNRRTGALQSLFLPSSSRHPQVENQSTTNGSHPPSPSRAITIRRPEAEGRSGVMLSTNPNHRSGSTVIETTRPQDRDSDMMTANPYISAWAQGDAAQYARDLQEDFQMRQRLRDLAE